MAAHAANHGTSYEPYSDHAGASVRHSNPDLDDFYEGVPPPHRLSNLYAHSPLSSTDNLNPGPTTSTTLGADSQPHFTALPSASQPDLPLNPFANSARTMSQPPQRAYNNLDGGYGASPWLEQQQSRSRRSKYIVVGSLVALIGVIIIGVAVGVSLSKKNSGNKGAVSSESSSGGAPVNQTDPNDPSTFVKDDRLTQSFYGLAYTPENSQYPACGNKLSEVIGDVQLLSQLTKRIRLYGADCNQSALVLEAIRQTKVDMTVYLGIYNIPTDSTPYTRQKAAILDALKTYGTDHVGGVTVGNEFMLNYLTNNAPPNTLPDSPIGNQGAALLIPNITDMKTSLTSMGYNIAVGNSDAGSFFNTEVLNAIDYGMSNVHPWFANVTVATAASWTEDFFNTNNVIPAAATSKQPQMYIAETGWPTKSSDLGNANNGASDASEANLQVFMDTFVCDANTKGTRYFFFEFKDEPWKDAQFGGVEGWWGVFTSNRTLKNIKIPNCPIS